VPSPSLTILPTPPPSQARGTNLLRVRAVPTCVWFFGPTPYGLPGVISHMPHTLPPVDDAARLAATPHHHTPARASPHPHYAPAWTVWRTNTTLAIPALPVWTCAATTTSHWRAALLLRASFTHLQNATALLPRNTARPTHARAPFTPCR